jgi:beta-galactosidase
MITLGAQYYRPPFPDARYWDDDFAQIARSGLNTVQLWVLWGWVEPSPGEWIFDDYDRLVETAARHRLGVVLSTISEIQPYWIHREVAGSEMIDNMGNKVISSHRRECHVGMTPGGCIDHPRVWEHMAAFFSTVATRYRSAPNLTAWDAWNETRWNVNADGFVCYCPHTLQAFRAWLTERYGSLEGLNQAWRRRYRSWDDVLPGKMPERTYTEMMAFEHFLTWRSVQHGKARCALIKSIDPSRPVTIHDAAPSVMHGADRYPVGTALHRGNDWFYADALDGIGCSSFPVWEDIDDPNFSARISYITSAARGKHIWLSELQGGRAATGDTPHKPVPPDRQQRWLWRGLAGGADTILFWCWRDEVFGRESAGFGIVGKDGYADARVAALQKTGQLLKRHAALIEGFRADAAEVGVLFSPQSYYQNWAHHGTALMAQRALQGYTRALILRNIPYLVVEEEHLDALQGLKVLFMPRTNVVDAEVAASLSAFVRQGGTLFAEAECGAFGSNGIYRYPNERFLAELTGISDIGRRALVGDSIDVTLDGKSYRLPGKQWLTPFPRQQGTVLAEHEEGSLLTDVAVAKGRVLLCGTYLGEPYFEGSSEAVETYAPCCQDFEHFVEALVARAGVVPPVTAGESGPAPASPVLVNTGASGGKRMCFVFAEKGQNVELHAVPAFFKGQVTDIVSGAQVKVENSRAGQACRLSTGDWGLAVLAETGRR